MKKPYKFIERQKVILGGTPVFKDTPVPLKTFLKYLEAGYLLNASLEDFPTVSRQSTIDVLESFKDQLLQPQ